MRPFPHLLEAGSGKVPFFHLRLKQSSHGDWLPDLGLSMPDGPEDKVTAVAKSSSLSEHCCRSAACSCFSPAAERTLARRLSPVSRLRGGRLLTDDSQHCQMQGGRVHLSYHAAADVACNGVWRHMIQV